MGEEPVLGVVALTNRENEVISRRVQLGVPLPQAVLPVPIFPHEELAGVSGVGVGDEELRRRPVRDADLPQRRARPRRHEHEVAKVHDGAACRHRHRGGLHVVSEEPRNPRVEAVRSSPDAADAEPAGGRRPRPELVPLALRRPGARLPAGRGEPDERRCSRHVVVVAALARERVPDKESAGDRAPVARLGEVR